MRICRSGLAAVILCGHALTATTVGATENGVGHYANGSEAFLGGAAPPPGFYIINHLSYYESSRLNDGSGNRLPIDFRVRAYAEVPRFVYSTPVDILGGNLLLHTIVPFVDLEVEVNQRRQRKRGVGDIVFGPAVAWHTRNLHWVLGVDGIAPTGSYSKRDLANIGLNYWTISPVATVTYLSEGGFDVSAAFHYHVNLTNTATDYRSGQELQADFAVGQQVGDWKFGVSGYYYQQLTDDRAPGVVGNRGFMVAAGPIVQYNLGKVSLQGYWQKELVTENRSQGDKYWFKALIAF